MKSQLSITAIERIPGLAMKVIDREGHEEKLDWLEQELSVDEYLDNLRLSAIRGRILSIEEIQPIVFRGRRRQRGYRILLADEQDENEFIGVTVPRALAHQVQVGQVAHFAMFAAPTKLNLESPLMASVTPELKPVHVATLPRKLLGQYEVKLQQTRPPVTDVVDIPTLRLHCPRNKGCTATLVRRMRRRQTRDFSAKIIGIGGGASLKITYDQVETIRTRGPCLQQLERVKVAYRYGNLLANEHIIALGYPRVDVLEHVESLGLHNIPKRFDLCGSGPETVRSLVADCGYEEDTIRFSGTTPGKASQDFEFFFEKETAANLCATFQLQLGGVPVTMGVEYERATISGVGTKYHLLSGKDYQWYKLPGSIERYWTVR